MQILTPPAGHVRLTLVIGLVFLGGLTLWWSVRPEIALENRAMENLQVATLLAAWLWTAGALVAQRRFAEFAGWFYLVFLATVLLRELDVEDLAVPAVLVTLGSGTGRNLLMGALWLLLAAAAVRHFGRFRTEAACAWRAPWGRYFLGGLLTAVLAAPLDKKLLPFSRPTQMFCEEALENLAMLLLAVSVILWSRRARPKTRGER